MGEQPLFHQHPGNVGTAQAFGTIGFLPDLGKGQGISQGIDSFHDLPDPGDPSHPGPGHGLEQGLVIRVEMVAQHMDILSLVIRIDFHPPDQFQIQMAEMDGPGCPVVGLDVVVVRNGNGRDPGSPGLGHDFFRCVDAVRKSGMDM
jgi:hypothetical protein